MAFEQYSNLASTTLGANYTAGSGVLQVVTTAPPFPTSGNFRVFVADPTTGVVKVILKVTAVTDGTHFAVTAEGTDANAVTADVVKVSLTAGGMDAIRGDLVQTGALASAVNNKAGNLYLPKDALNILRDTGSAFDTFGPVWGLANPNLQSWTQQDFGSCTSDVTHGGISIENPTTEGAFNTHALVFNAPATPYHVEFGYVHFKNGSGNYMCGACFSDGTKYEIFDPFFQDAQGSMVCFYLTNATSFGGTPINSSFGSTFGYPYVYWVRLGDDGTNKTWDISVDGFIWKNIGSEARTTNLTATKLGVYVNNGPSFIRLLSAKITG